MKGVILAAGIGSRLRPMTDDKPKCLVKVSGKPMLEYQLDAYRMAGIKDIVIVIGYKGEHIERYCRYINDLNITIIKNEEYEETNNMYSLYLAKEHLQGEPFILNNADLVIEKEIIANMLAAKEDNLVAVDVGLYNDESMKIICDSEGYIRDISKKIPQDRAVGCSIDFYKISHQISTLLFKEITETIEEGNRKNWTEVALQRIFQRKDVLFSVLNISKYKWVEIDNCDDLALADMYFSQLNRKITDYKCYLFDLDGTLYVGKNVINEAIDSVRLLQKQGKIVKFLSNNSSKSKQDYVSRLNELGIQCNVKDIILSTDATLRFLSEKEIKRVYVLGTEKLKQSLIENGFKLSEDDAEIVVIGYDTELTYSKLITASKLINKGIDYIATHKDIFCPTEFGPIPDIGSFIQMLEMTTKVAPLKIFGKPDISMVELVAKELNIDKSDMLMIGDRLYTDILMAKNFAIDSVLVLSGDTTRDMLEVSDISPTYVLKSFNVLY
ncbi:HAD-IIA family hydrolase [Glaesserella parasuis]|uniref:HAD hydrolase, family IIA n=1 Tax=Glaesserella parasuis TaxID=738 RepID=T1RQ74_GLAPU|nr:HAD-IIA family hydrolase [Glaesserella parasuis]EQA05977.1 HAD hydrolase, IIA family protein [Glaesserella parasuis 12939]EQA13700.1 HAD hydrolase, IIA family protein [Glaesserella parasuis SW140]EQA14790.1 HAD hydrolase, IIA family protein [Glaesserella parasuis H465]AGM38623.1 HAD hydrolase, family IIA [Glaesserella parasuis]AGM38643.1 HAD hydrolase, family IIA [Glaesserella parasuis]